MHTSWDYINPSKLPNEKINFFSFISIFLPKDQFPYGLLQFYSSFRRYIWTRIMLSSAFGASSTSSSIVLFGSIVQVISAACLIFFYESCKWRHQKEGDINTITLELRCFFLHHLNGHYVGFFTTLWMLEEGPFLRTGKLADSNWFI